MIDHRPWAEHCGTILKTTFANVYRVSFEVPIWIFLNCFWIILDCELNFKYSPIVFESFSSFSCVKTMSVTYYVCIHPCFSMLKQSHKGVVSADSAAAQEIPLSGPKDAAFRHYSGAVGKPTYAWTSGAEAWRRSPVWRRYRLWKALTCTH